MAKARRFKNTHFLRSEIVAATNINEAITMAVYITANSFFEPTTAKIINLLAQHNSGGTARYMLLLEEEKICFWNGNTQRNSTIGMTAADGDCIVGVKKAAGTVKPVFFKYKVSTETWTFQEHASTLANATAPGTTGTYRFNEYQNGQRGDVTYYSAAVWNVNKTEAEVKELATTLIKWKEVGTDAKELWFFNQTSTGEEVKGLIAESKQKEITGTEVVESTQGLPYEEVTGKTVQGEVEFSLSFVPEIEGVRKVLGESEPTLNITAEIEGLRKALGEIELPLALALELEGLRRAVAELEPSIQLLVEVEGARKVLAELESTFTITPEIEGLRRALAELELALSLSIEVTGTRKTFGEVQSILQFSIEVDGKNISEEEEPEVEESQTIPTYDMRNRSISYG